jgi:hypothetical protein
MNGLASLQLIMRRSGGGRILPIGAPLLRIELERLALVDTTDLISIGSLELYSSGISLPCQAIG